jgi:hypothetical protein
MTEMIHYHGTPITPIETLLSLAGKCFCVSHMAPADVARCHMIGQSVMLDNGAFSKWKSKKETNWPKYYAWCDKWLDCPSTWAVPPDVINEPSQEQDALLNEWPHGKRQAAPVWHMDEPIYRLLRLCEQGWNRVCIGSTDRYQVVLSEAWEWKMDEVFNNLAKTFGRIPPMHMLRGMQCSGKRWPFISVDSTDVAQNHNRPQNTALAMANRWDASQCPSVWRVREHEQLRIAV